MNEEDSKNPFYFQKGEFESKNLSIGKLCRVLSRDGISGSGKTRLEKLNNLLEQEDLYKKVLNLNPTRHCPRKLKKLIEKYKSNPENKDTLIELNRRALEAFYKDYTPRVKIPLPPEEKAKRRLIYTILYYTLMLMLIHYLISTGILDPENFIYFLTLFIGGSLVFNMFFLGNLLDILDPFGLTYPDIFGDEDDEEARMYVFLLPKKRNLRIVTAFVVSFLIFLFLYHISGYAPTRSDAIIFIAVFVIRLVFLLNYDLFDPFYIFNPLPWEKGKKSCSKRLSKNRFSKAIMSVFVNVNVQRYVLRGLFAVIFIILVVAITSPFYISMRFEPEYPYAMNIVKKSPVVQKTVGTPVKTGIFVFTDYYSRDLASMTVKGRFNTSVYGPKGSAKIMVYFYENPRGSIMSIFLRDSKGKDITVYSGSYKLLRNQ